jgi:hypothetical protein
MAVSEGPPRQRIYEMKVNERFGDQREQASPNRVEIDCMYRRGTVGGFDH